MGGAEQVRKLRRKDSGKRELEGQISTYEQNFCSNLVGFVQQENQWAREGSSRKLVIRDFGCYPLQGWLRRFQFRRARRCLRTLKASYYEE